MKWNSSAFIGTIIFVIYICIPSIESFKQHRAIKRKMNFSALHPRLLIIAGATGSGKSTLGMAVAVAQRYTKCVSTDTIREVARVYDSSPSMKRASYDGNGDAVAEWRETVVKLHDAVVSVVDHTIDKKKCMTLEGVSLIPNNEIINRWQIKGGIALGVLLTIPDSKQHLEILRRRGYEYQIKNFDRIRRIQDEMIKEALTHHWTIMEQTDIFQMVGSISDIQDNKVQLFLNKTLANNGSDIGLNKYDKNN
jgi:2-phosphoglycerate kinase